MSNENNENDTLTLFNETKAKVQVLNNKVVETETLIKAKEEEISKLQQELFTKFNVSTLEELVARLSTLNSEVNSDLESLKGKLETVEGEINGS